MIEETANEYGILMGDMENCHVDTFNPKETVRDRALSLTKNYPVWKALEVKWVKWRGKMRKTVDVFLPVSNLLFDNILDP